MFRHHKPLVMRTITEQIDQIQYDRIGERIDDYITQGKLTQLERDIFISAAMRDESRIFAILDGKPSYYQKLKARWRPTFAGEKFQNLVNACPNNPAKLHDEMVSLGIRHFATPRNENTITSALTANFLISGVVTQAHQRFAPLKVAT